MRLLGETRARAAVSRTIGVLGLTALLAACGGGDGGGDREGRLTSMLLGPAGGGQSTLDLPDPPRETDRRCPPVAVRDGTETMRVYARGMENDPRSVVYQGSIRNTARECTYSGSTISMNLGIAGRVVLGPQGQGGDLRLPVRAAFLPRGGQPTWTNLFHIPVTLAPGETGTNFTFVEQNIQLEIPEGQSPGSFVLYVGFDELADGRG